MGFRPSAVICLASLDNPRNAVQKKKKKNDDRFLGECCALLVHSEHSGGRRDERPVSFVRENWGVCLLGV